MKIIDINGEERECVKVYPDPQFAGYMKVEFVSKNRIGYTHSEWYPMSDFVHNNPGLKKLTTMALKVIEDDLGVVSSAKKDSLTDSTKKWTINEYIGFPIWISRGLGEGQTRKVKSNTKNTLIVDKPWKEVPNGTSQYVLSHNIHNPQVRGNTLPKLDKLKKN
jgi:hypothetical protein